MEIIELIKKNKIIELSICPPVGEDKQWHIFIRKDEKIISFHGDFYSEVEEKAKMWLRRNR